MVTVAPSMFSMVAMAFYAVVCAACIAAMATAISNEQQVRHVRGWAILAVFFVLLIALRGFSLEELLRDNLRAWAKGDGTYANRQGFQRPLTIGLVIAAAVAALAWVALATRGMDGRRSMALVSAQVAALGMVFLIALRMISLNVLDKILYGPLKLNWIGDLGMSAVVAGGAIFYALVVRGKFGRRRVRKGR